jgi:hypothetical protein
VETHLSGQSFLSPFGFGARQNHFGQTPALQDPRRLGAVVRVRASAHVATLRPARVVTQGVYESVSTC